MSFSWLPKPCADPELTMEFLSIRNWTWWLDAEATTAVPFDDVATGNFEELFVTREFHLYHCTYMWRKLHRGMLKAVEMDENRGIVDSYVGDYKHTAHCEMILIGMKGDHGVVDMNATDTVIGRKFPQCVWV
jgi:hypothetical protein